VNASLWGECWYFGQRLDALTSESNGFGYTWRRTFAHPG
jgi:hypothetical protein